MSEKVRPGSNNELIDWYLRNGFMEEPVQSHAINGEPYQTEEDPPPVTSDHLKAFNATDHSPLIGQFSWCARIRKIFCFCCCKD